MKPSCGYGGDGKQIATLICFSSGANVETTQAATPVMFTSERAKICCPACHQSFPRNVNWPMLVGLCSCLKTMRVDSLQMQGTCRWATSESTLFSRATPDATR